MFDNVAVYYVAVYVDRVAMWLFDLTVEQTQNCCLICVTLAMLQFDKTM